MPRMLGCSVCDVPLQNSSFHDTWLCQKKSIKIQWGNESSDSSTLHFELKYFSYPRQKFSKKMTRMLRSIVPDDPLQNSSFHGILILINWYLAATIFHQKSADSENDWALVEC